MARSKGDVTVSTFFFICDCLMAEKAMTLAEATEQVRTLCEAGESEKVSDLVKWAESTTKGERGKPGRKSMVDVQGITARVLGSYKAPDGQPFTPESYAALPDGTLRTALNTKVAAAINAAKAEVRAARASADLDAILTPNTALVPA